MVSSTTSLFNTMFYFVNDFLYILKVSILYFEFKISIFWIPEGPF